MHQFLVKLHNKYGPIASFWYGTEYCISIGNAEHMKKVKHLFDRPAKLFELVEPQVGKNLLLLLMARMVKEDTKLWLTQCRSKYQKD